VTARSARRLAWSLFAVSISLSVGGIVFGVRNDGELAHALIVALIAALPFPLIGALIASRFPKNAIGWIFCAVGLLQGLNSATDEYARYALITEPGSFPLSGLAAWVAFWTWMPSLGLLTTFLLLLFPDGRLASRRWRWAAWMAGIGIALVVLGAGAAAAGFSGRELLGETLTGYPTIAAVAAIVGGVLVLVAAIGSVAALVTRFRGSRGEERQQLKWMAFAGSFALLAIAIAFTPATEAEGWVGAIAGNLVVPGLLAVPVAAAIAILKYRLYAIDLVISKTVVYGALALFITAVYVAIVVGLGVLIGRGGEPNVALSIAATAVVAVAFQPVRERVQRFANRLVYGDRASPYDVLARFSERVAGTYATEDVLPRTARVIAEGTGAARAEVWLRIDRELVISAAWPDEVEGDRRVALANGELPTFDGTDRALPVRHMDEMLGAVTVTKPRGDRLTPAEERLLADLASQAGSVLRSVSLTAELQARLEQISAQAGELRVSRQRIVAAHDAERRRLERNIHDGAQQHLVALAVKLRLAKSVAARDPEKARRMLEGLLGETMEALDTLTDLSRGIYPSVLEEHGIAAALEAQAARSTLPIGIEVDGVGRYPIEAEAAVYFCCLEALQNASKYADATSIEIRVAESGDELAFSVTDDGSGFDPATSGAGSGLQNMRDRVAAIGGGVEITSSPGRGTKVNGRIPVSTVSAREPAR
jgi:signal transduction histidine kinase